MIFATYRPNDYGLHRIPYPDNAPTNNAKLFDFSGGSLDALLGKAKNTRTYKTKIKSVGPKFVMGIGASAASHFFDFSGLGIINAVKHGTAAAKTHDHLKGLGSINTAKCKCRGCDRLLGYIYNQKDKKLDRRMLSMAPGLSTYETIRSKGNGLYKKLNKTAGVDRERNACQLWVAAKDGCPVAKQILDELFGGVDGLMKVVGSYLGILAVADKLKST